MCLIVAGAAAKIRSTLLNNPDLLNDIYTSNPDGSGAMWANTKGLKVTKVLPNSLDDLRKHVETFPNDERNLVWHMRMKTHGKIDLDNCHPYDVVPGKVAMVHNGILHTGNDADVTRSDTWHFIQDFLAEAVTMANDLVHNAGFLLMLEEFIGSNRFVFMDATGRMTIVNKDQGISHDGMWFANEYAWDPALLIPGYGKRSYGGGARYTNYTGRHTDLVGRGWQGATWDDEGTDGWADYYRERGADSRQLDWTVSTKSWGPQARTKFLESVMYCDSDGVTDTLDSYPHAALMALYEDYIPSLTKHMSEPDAVTKLADNHAALLLAAMNSDRAKLARECATRPGVVADVLCYYIDWTLKPEASDDEVPVTAAEADECEDDHDDMVNAFTGSVTYMRHTIELYNHNIDGWTYVIVDHNNEEVYAESRFLKEQGALDAARAYLDRTVELTSH